MRPPQDRVTRPQVNVGRWGRGGCAGLVGGGLLFLALVFAISGWNTVESGKVGVTRRFGEIQNVKGAGGFWALPIGFSMVEYDLRVVNTLSDQQAALSNQQTLFVNNVAYQYNLSPGAAQLLQERIGSQQTFEDKVVIPKLQNAIKTITPLYNANDVFPKRGEIEQKMEERLSEDLAEYSIVPNSVDITLADIDFDPEFRKSIDAKAKAQQEQQVEQANLEKLKTKNEQEIQQTETDAKRAQLEAKGKANAAREAAQGEADSVKLRAAAEAEANERVNKTVTAQLINYRYAQQWNGQLPSTQIGQGSGVGALLQIPANNK